MRKDLKMIAIDPVSYTHRDVDKRQVLRRFVIRVHRHWPPVLMKMFWNSLERHWEENVMQRMWVCFSDRD